MTGLCLLIPDASYDLGRGEWTAQADMLAAMFPARGVAVVLEPWSGDADLAAHALVVPTPAASVTEIELIEPCLERAPDGGHGFVDTVLREMASA